MVVSMNDVRRSAQAAQVAGDLNAVVPDFLRHGAQNRRIDQRRVSLPLQLARKVSDYNFSSSKAGQARVRDKDLQGNSEVL
jgi:hypothetical protein